MKIRKVTLLFFFFFFSAYNIFVWYLKLYQISGISLERSMRINFSIEYFNTSWLTASLKPLILKGKFKEQGITI